LVGGRLRPLVECPILSVFAGGGVAVAVVGGEIAAAMVGNVVGETDAAMAGAIVVGVGATTGGQFVGAAICPEFDVG
jgi:hypothetical protein